MTETNELTQVTPTNHNAVFSILAGILTLLSICLAVVPVPLTGFVCYPAGALFGVAALATGITSLRQIRSNGEKGRALALIGAGIGGLTLVGVICALTMGIILLPEIRAFIEQASR
jgi:hypothetical protein